MDGKHHYNGTSSPPLDIEDDVWADFDSAIELGNQLRREDKLRKLNNAYLARKSKGCDGDTEERKISEGVKDSVLAAESGKSSSSKVEVQTEAICSDIKDTASVKLEPEIGLNTKAIEKADDAIDSGVGMPQVPSSDVSRSDVSGSDVSQAKSSSPDLSASSNMEPMKSASKCSLQDRASLTPVPSVSAPELDPSVRAGQVLINHQLQFPQMGNQQAPDTPANTPDIASFQSEIGPIHARSTLDSAINTDDGMHDSGVKRVKGCTDMAKRRPISRDLQRLLNTEDQLEFYPDPEKQSGFGITRMWQKDDSDAFPHWKGQGGTDNRVDRGPGDWTIQSPLEIDSECRESESDSISASSVESMSSVPQPIRTSNGRDVSDKSRSADKLQTSRVNGRRILTRPPNDRGRISGMISEEDFSSAQRLREQEKMASIERSLARSLAQNCRCSTGLLANKKSHRSIIMVRQINSSDTKYPDVEDNQSVEVVVPCRHSIGYIDVRTDQRDDNLPRRVWLAIRKAGRRIRSVARMCTGCCQ